MKAICILILEELQSAAQREQFVNHQRIRVRYT